MSDSLKAMTLSLNSLLTDVYGVEKRASEILVDFGLEQSHIDVLKGEMLGTFYANIKFALECRFLHYSNGHRLLIILCRRYGLFGHKKETLEEIGNSMGVSRERVRQLQNKAIKRLVGGTSADATSILLVLCACHTLGLDVMEILGKEDTLVKASVGISEYTSEETEAQDKNDDSEKIIKQTKPIDLPKATFYISGGFDYGLGRGKYRMLMEYGEHRKYIEKQNLEGRSDVSMILLAVIEGLEMLKMPFDVMVYSNTLFGTASIYKHGALRQEVPIKASNYELKEKIRWILEEQGHYLSNIVDSEIKAKLTTYESLEHHRYGR